MILVTGATGNVGREVVRAVLDTGERVCALTRGPGSPLPDGVDRAIGDLDRPETLAAPLHGARGVFLLPGYRDMAGVLAEIRRAGAEHVVLLSGGSAGDGDLSNAVSHSMIRSEEAVRGSGVPWTILRPSAFMSNALQWVPQLRAGDLVRAPFAHVRAAVIDPADIGLVAALALRSGGEQGATHRVSGPEALLPAERLRILAGVLGRELHFEAQPDGEARAEMTATMPAEYVDAFFGFYVDGTLDESEVLPAVRELTGRAPRTFEQWAHAHVDAFR